MTDLMPERADAASRRALVPTPREQGLGVEASEHDFTAGQVAEAPRRSLKDVAVAWARDADPRHINGPKTPLLILSVGAFLAAWNAGGFAVLLPEIQSEFGLNIFFLISLGSLLTTLGLVLALPFGYLADRVSRVRMVQVGAAVGAASTVAQSMAPNVSALVSTAVTGGVGAAVTQPAGYPLFTDWYPAETRARVFTFFAGSAALGGVLGPIVAGHVATWWGWRQAVLLLGALSCLSALLTLFLREPKRGYLDRLASGAPPEDAAREQAPLSLAEGVRAAFSIVSFRRVCFASPFLYVAGAGLPVFTIVYFARTFQLDAGQRGDILTISATFGLLGLVLSGPLADRLLAVSPGRLVTLLGLAVLLQCVFLVVFAVSPWLWLSVAATWPQGFIGALLGPASAVLLSLVVPARVRGLGLQMAAPFNLLGVIMLGALATHVSGAHIRHAFLLLVPFVVIGGIIVLSAASGVDRDIRAARAAAMADEAARKARARGQNKMLVCRDVDVAYDGVQVLFNVDFDVEEGEIIALLGTNGAGKSTLLKAIAGVREAANGAIFLDGRDITHMPPYENAANGVVLMPGGQATFPTLSVEDNLRSAAWMYREDDAYVAARTEQVLEFFPVLRERLQQPAGNLSGGEQQMVGLGQAFLMRPRLLMIDELSLGLAPSVVAKLLDILRAIHAQGTTIVLVEQSINVALTIADRAVYMEKGQVVFEGPTEELLDRPDLVRAVFMGGGTISRGRTRPSARQATATPQDDNLLTVSGVSVTFGGIQALRQASLHVADGEIVGIIGPNGAGKTTLFDVVSGFVVPDEGVVALGGTDLSGLPPDARARLGLARSFQNARLFPSLTVRENLAVALERRASRNPILAALWLPSHRRAEARLHLRIDDLIDILGLGRYADKFVRELSTGTRRAVDVACIMAAEPTLLLLDEPSSGLAQAETEQLGPVLLRVARQTGASLLLIEHDLRLITSVSDRLVAMELGATIATGPPDEVVNDPRVLASYLAASTDTIDRSGGNRSGGNRPGEGRAERIAAALAPDAASSRVNRQERVGGRAASRTRRVR
jgi:branched-chain amino acid transport system ATP-binding protein